MFCLIPDYIFDEGFKVPIAIHIFFSVALMFLFRGAYNSLIAKCTVFGRTSIWIAYTDGVVEGLTDLNFGHRFLFRTLLIRIVSA